MRSFFICLFFVLLFWLSENFARRKMMCIRNLLMIKKSIAVYSNQDKKKIRIYTQNRICNQRNFARRKISYIRINFYLLLTFCPHLGIFFCVVSSFTSFRPNFTSGLLQEILPRPRIGILGLVTVSPVITAFHSCCLSHHVFDQVNLWPAWVGFETAIFWQCSPGTVETQRLCPLRHGPRRAIKDGFFWSYKSLSGLQESGPYRIFVLVFNWNHFEMRLFNLRINFYLLRTFCPHLGRN